MNRNYYRSDLHDRIYRHHIYLVSFVCSVFGGMFGALIVYFIQAVFGWLV